jgi:uncharacterized protein (DUF433 family)
MIMSTASLRYQYLARKPKSFYRQLFIKDRWISARTLYGLHVNEEQAMTVEEIATDYDLPVAAVQEAIAYCASSPPEIAEDAAREEAIALASGENEPDYRFHPKPRSLSAEETARLGR